MIPAPGPIIRFPRDVLLKETFRVQECHRDMVGAVIRRGRWRALWVGTLADDLEVRVLLLFKDTPHDPLIGIGEVEVVRECHSILLLEVVLEVEVPDELDVPASVQSRPYTLHVEGTVPIA